MPRQSAAALGAAADSFRVHVINSNLFDKDTQLPHGLIARVI
jgi:hypothetical protein